MTFLDKINVIERVDQLIRMKSTGTAEELAVKLGVCRSTVFEILACMRIMGAEIGYNEHKKTYYYTIEKKLSIGFI